MPCNVLGPGLIVCTAPPTKFWDAEPATVRWCFKCHEHRMHFLVVEDPMSPWFDTEFRLRCDRCGDLATDMNGNCVDLGKWTDEMRAAWETLEARADSWPKRVFFCLGCQRAEPAPGDFKEGYCPECAKENGDKKP